MVALDGEGRAKEFAGFEQWQDWVKTSHSKRDITTAKMIKPRQKSAPSKLSYKMQMEFDGMEEAIAVAEAEVERAETVANVEAVTSNHQMHAKACVDVAEAQEAVRLLYERWIEIRRDATLINRWLINFSQYSEE